MLPPALKNLVVICFAAKRQKLGGWKARKRGKEGIITWKKKKLIF